MTIATVVISLPVALCCHAGFGKDTPFVTRLLHSQKQAPTGPDRIATVRYTVGIEAREKGETWTF